MNSNDALFLGIEALDKEITRLRRSKVYAMALPDPVHALDDLYAARATLEALREHIAEQVAP